MEVKLVLLKIVLSERRIRGKIIPEQVLVWLIENKGTTGEPMSRTIEWQ